MIDSGVPAAAEDWPPGTLEALAPWEQGDVVAGPPLFYFADPAFPVWEATRLYKEGSAGPEVIFSPDSHLPPYGLVISQTCDIGETDSERPLRPWVQIAPIYAVKNKGWRKKLLRGVGPRYLIVVPDLPADEVWAADLRIEVPVEKGWLARQERIQGFATEEAKAAVGRRLAWLRGRPAFSTDFNVTILDPLNKALTDLQDEDEDLHDALLQCLEEVAVLVDSLLHPSVVELVFLTNGPMDNECREWLQAWRDDRVGEAQGVGIDLLPLNILDSAEVNSSEYRRMVIVWAR